MSNDRLLFYVHEQLHKHLKRWIVISPEFITSPPKKGINVIMSMTNYQEVNVDLAKHPLMKNQRKEAKDILVFIV
jgi:hypothetical protein